MVSCSFDIYDVFMLGCCFSGELGSTTPGVGNICNHIFRLL